LKKIAIGSVVALALLVGTVFGVGAMIPADHIASLTVRYQQPPETIWLAITDYSQFPAWRTFVDQVEPLETANGVGGWIELTSTGALPLAIDESTAPRRLVLRIAADNLGFGGTWTYEITAVEGGSRLTITENGNVSNLLFRFMSRFVFGYTTTIETYLIDLGNKFDEQVTPQPAG